MNKKIFLWALYDFGNSLVLMAFIFYFSQWLVIDQGKPAWWYNVALIAASGLFIVTAPYLSRRVDITKKKINGLRICTAVAFVLHLLVALMIMLLDNVGVYVTIIYVIATYVYLLCFVYYTPMLNDLSTNETRSKISGIGQAANSIGQVFGVLVTIPFINGITFFGEPGRAQALLPGVVLFALFTFPLLLWYRENPPVQTGLEPKAKAGYIALFKEVFSYKALALLLLAYFVYSDALLTFANNFPLYLEVVHGVSDVMKSVLTASILILAAVGAIVFGKIAQRKGELKVLQFIIGAWVVAFFLIAFVSTFSLLVPVFIVAGLLFGPAWSISRSLVGRMTPPHLVASSYNFYTLAERFATFIGPALWSVALLAMGEGVAGYRGAIIVMMILMLISYFIVRKIKLVS